MTQRTLLVTSALPYANGPIHLGHLVEHIQTDIWTRFQKMRGHNCWYVCADDAHGTPIMLKAQKEGKTPEELVAFFQAQHQQDFADFLINHDHYYSTHSPENTVLAQSIYQQLKAAGHISQRTIEQAYDEQAQMFLPDRFIKGDCPRCGAVDQYGDSCETCGATYDPTDLKNPVSVVSGSTPVTRESEHYFFKLADFEAFLRQWTAHHVQPEIANKLAEWFDNGLNDWDISRDAPYFGIKIPDTEDKYFYVWLDAPIGYIASFQHFARSQGWDVEQAMMDYWHTDQTELYHFIGKDIAYFHTLFWPAMLKGANYRTPTAVYCHGFLTVDGKKMSKSRGTFINARTYLDHLRPEYFRYYMAAKLTAGIEDIDLNLEDFVARVNSDLVGKIVNIASRCAGFISKRFEGQLATVIEPGDQAVLDALSEKANNIATLYEQRQFAQAMREIMALADLVNQYVDEQKPWVMIKDDSQLTRVQQVCTAGLEAFRQLIIYLKPVLPQVATDVETFLNTEPLMWHDLQTPIFGHTIQRFKPLMQRIEPEGIQQMIEDSRQLTPEPAAPLIEPLADEITFDDFMRVDLRVAKIISAEHVDGADKLLRLVLALDEQSQVTKQVFAGIRSDYNPDDLVDRYTVMVANLKPRKMKFGLSEGMVVASSSTDTEGLYLLAPDPGAKAGMRIK